MLTNCLLPENQNFSLRSLPVTNTSHQIKHYPDFYFYLLVLPSFEFNIYLVGILIYALHFPHKCL